MPSPSDKRRVRSGPGRSSATRPGRAMLPAAPVASAPAVRSARSAPRPRLTGRAAILVLVLAVLAVSYASSLRAYLQQRAHIVDLQSTITERQQQIGELEREKKRWNDDEFVRAQARERLGYVMPGETVFVALRGGLPLESESTLTDPQTDTGAERVWWDDAWESVVVAGDPPTRVEPQPLTRIADPEGAPEESSE